MNDTLMLYKQIESTTVDESETVHFETRVEPKDDSKLRVEWFRNGRPLPTGSRYRNVFDLGFVSLDVSHFYAEDSGEYVCRATNDFGVSETRATVSCKSEFLELYLSYFSIHVDDSLSVFYRTTYNRLTKSSTQGNEEIRSADADGSRSKEVHIGDLFDRG